MLGHEFDGIEHRRIRIDAVDAPFVLDELRRRLHEDPLLNSLPDVNAPPLRCNRRELRRRECCTAADVPAGWTRPPGSPPECGPRGRWCAAGPRSGPPVPPWRGPPARHSPDRWAA